MTPEQRAEFVAWLRRVRMRPAVADQLEADGVTIVTLTAERDAAKDGEKTARNLMQKAFDVNRKVIAERDAAQAEIARLTSERPYIVGWNHGFDEANYQHEHGCPSDGGIEPKFVYTEADMAAALKKVTAT